MASKLSIVIPHMDREADHRHDSLRHRKQTDKDGGIAKVTRYLRIIRAPKMPSVKATHVPQHVRGVSFCILCKEKRHQLEHTLARNLETIRNKNAEIVVVNYHSEDGLADWVLADFADAMKDGRFQFYQLLNELPFSIPIGKNFAHRLGRMGILVNLEADNFIGDLWHAAQTLGFNEFLACKERVNGSSGGIGLWRGDFERLNGYDEAFELAEYQNADLKERAQCIGLHNKHWLCDRAAVQNDKVDTVKFLDGSNRADWEAMHNRNKSAGYADRTKGRWRANTSGLTTACFRHNFREIITLGHEFCSTILGTDTIQSKGTTAIAEVQCTVANAELPERRATPEDMNVTACIPYFQCKDRIVVAVQSLLSQTFKHLTVVVINDGDPNPPWDVLDHISDPRLVRFELKENHGPYFATAIVLNATASPFLLIQDADDWSHPHRITRLMKLITSSGAHLAVSSHTQIRSLADGTCCIKGTTWRAGFTATLNGAYLNRAPHQGLFRKRALMEIGGYYGGFPYAYDMLLTNLILMTGNIAHDRRALYYKWQRPDSLTHCKATGTNSEARLQAKAKMATIYLEAYSLYKRVAKNQISRQEFLQKIRGLTGRYVSPQEREIIRLESDRLAKLLKCASRK